MRPLCLPLERCASSPPRSAARRLALVVVCGLLMACEVPKAAPLSSATTPLLATNVLPVAPIDPIRRAEEDQLAPDIARGAGSEALVVWTDSRNFRFHQTDLYGARLRIGGGAIDTLGLPLVTGAGVEVEPSVAFDGARYTLVWTTGAERLVKATRFASPDALTDSRVIAFDADRARVAAGGGHTLIVHRYNIGRPRGLLLDADGGTRLQPDGGAVLSFEQAPLSYFPGPIQAVWDESQQLFVVGITDSTYGIWLSRLDPLAPVPGAIQRIAAGPLSGNGDNVGLELAAAPDGTIAAAWRTDGTIAALVMPPGGSGFDGGTVLTTSASGPPSITWTGTRFRVLAPIGPMLTVHELFLDGGITAVDTLNGSAGIRPLAATEGPLVVYAAGSATDRFGADLFFQQRQEGVLDPSATLFTYSGRASHSPVAAWKTASNAMVAYSTSDDGGVQQHDLAYALFNPPRTFAPPAYLGGATRDDAFPRITDSLGNWWIGAYTPSAAKVFSAPDGTTTFREVFSFNSNGPPDLESGWLAFARDGDAMDFRRLLADGGVSPTVTDVILVAPWFPDLAVDGAGKPAATSVKRPGATTGIIFSPEPVGLTPPSLLSTSGGEPRAASVASDGTRFTAVYTTSVGSMMTVERRDLAYDDGGTVVNVIGPAVELAHAPLIETPFIAYAKGQYLVTWSERDDIVHPSRLKLMTLKTDGGTGAVVPLDLGAIGNDATARLAVNPNEQSALLTWTRLDSADSGVPTGFIAQLSIGAPVSATCAAGSECTTGFCADQVCCETACNEGCGTCSASGRCEPRQLGMSCQPLGECVVATGAGCDSVSTVCPSMPGNEGLSCDSGAGTCQQGVCVPTSAPDGGGAPDAGPPDDDAGTPDAGQPDAGPAASDGGADGGREDDGGVPMGVAPPSNFSHYSWAQGCGCSSGSDGMSVIVLALLFLGRIRRARGSVLSAAIVAVVLIAQPASAQQQKKLKLSFPGVAAGAGAKTEDANAIGEFVQTQLVALGIYEVTGSSDLAAMLGMERQKELLGCDTTCAVDIAGALDADRLLTSSLSKVGETWLLTMSLYDARKSQPIFRASRRFTGSLEKALDQIDPMLAELIEHDELAQATKPSVPTGTNQWSIGLRAELEAMGIIDGQPAIAPAVFGSWGRGIWGAAVTVIVLPTIGVRAEGRLHLLEASKIRPLFAIGATLFGTAFAPRGMLGVTADLGPVRLSLDAAIEYYVSGESRFQPLAILSSFGAAWRF